MSSSTEKNTPTRVVVGICTHRRNEELDRLLRALVGMSAEYTDLALGVVVADDNPDLSARSVVEPWQDSLTLGVHWKAVGAQNIAAGRNCLIDAAVELDAHLAYVDDDEMPEPSWLRELLGVQASTSADIVIGAIRLDFPEDAPEWLATRPPERYEVSVADGAEPEICLSGNALLTRDWMRTSGLRFDLPYGATGGEDSDFFMRASAAGAVIRYSSRSLVVEIVSPKRATARYQLAKEFRRGALAAHLSRRQLPRWRVAVRATRYVLAGLGGAIVQTGRSRREVFWHLAWANRGVGMLAGTLGFRFAHS